MQNLASAVMVVCRLLQGVPVVSDQTMSMSGNAAGEMLLKASGATADRVEAHAAEMLARLQLTEGAAADDAAPGSASKQAKKRCALLYRFECGCELA